MATQIRIASIGSVGDAFHQVAQGLSRVQEALRLQEQEAERRVQEALRLQEERAATALRQMEQQLRERDNAISALRHSLDERVRRLEARVAAVEERVRTSSAKRETEGTGEQGALGQLESRMGKLEGAVQRALASVFPRVEAVVERLESSPPGAPLSPAASTSSAPQPPAASVALGASVAGEAAADDVDCPKQQVERRIKEVVRRMRASRAAPSLLGEALCKATDPEEIRRLLDSGADVNYTNSHGTCPLMSAVLDSAGWDDPLREVVSLLLARGADPNSIDEDGWSALHCAVYHGVYHPVDLLIAAGADVDARDKHGATPLHVAASYDDDRAVRTLLAAGANRSLRGWGHSYVDKTPFDVARSDDVRHLVRP